MNFLLPDHLAKAVIYAFCRVSDAHFAGVFAHFIKRRAVGKEFFGLLDQLLARQVFSSITTAAFFSTRVIAL